jgi:hypothetical protein
MLMQQRCFLDNQRINQAVHYGLLVRSALTGLKGQKSICSWIGGLLHDHHTILVVSIGFRRRSLPLTWKVLTHWGKSSLVDQQDLLKLVWGCC